MTDRPKAEQWVYVAVEEPGGKERFVGLHDKKTDISYIPAFEKKEDALSCLVNMPRRKKKYEVQAVMFDLLCRDARQNGFLIFMLDGEGKIVQRIEP